MTLTKWSVGAVVEIAVSGHAVHITLTEIHGPPHLVYLAEGWCRKIDARAFDRGGARLRRAQGLAGGLRCRAENVPALAGAAPGARPHALGRRREILQGGQARSRRRPVRRRGDRHARTARRVEPRSRGVVRRRVSALELLARRHFADV